MMIHMENIRKIYGHGQAQVEALEGINLTVNEGEFMAVMGPSGSGKSTFMNILGCLDHATSGKYYLNGQSVTDMNRHDLSRIRSRTIGFVFQSFFLLPRLTALENVMLPLFYQQISRDERKMRAKAVLRELGLESRMSHAPSELSGGQCQRVAIARALVHQPPLLLADEPTGNLDTRTGYEIMELFRTLVQQGTTVVVITHEPDIAAYADTIAYLRDGMIEPLPYRRDEHA